MDTRSNNKRSKTLSGQPPTGGSRQRAAPEKTQRRRATRQHNDEGDEDYDSSPRQPPSKRRRLQLRELEHEESLSDEWAASQLPSATSRRAPGSPSNGESHVTLRSSDSEVSEYEPPPAAEHGGGDDDDEDDAEVVDAYEEPAPSAKQTVARKSENKRGRPPGAKNKVPAKVKPVSNRTAGRPKGSKNKHPRADKALPTSSVTLAASGSADLDASEGLDDPDSDQGQPLPLPDAAPKGKFKKAGCKGGGPPLLLAGENATRQVVMGQPCRRHNKEINRHLEAELKFTRDDSLVLARAMEHNTALSKLLQILWARFGCRLYDLFKFGLWLEVTAPGEGARPNTMRVGGDDDGFTVVNPYPKTPITESLRELAAHPFWDGDVDRLRYVLMYTVYCRVEGHDEPVVPILPLSATVIERCKASPQDVALLQYINSQENGISSQREVRLLCEEIRPTVTRHAARYKDERSLFLLRSSDVNYIAKALSRLSDPTTMHKLYQPTKWYFATWDKRNLTEWPRVKPREATELSNHLRDSVYRWRADHSVRQALKDVDGQYLYDVCEEHCPLTAECLNNIEAGEQGGPTQSQLDVVRGLVRPRFGLHMEVSDWRVPDENHAPPVRGPSKTKKTNKESGQGTRPADKEPVSVVPHVWTGATRKGEGQAGGHPPGDPFDRVFRSPSPLGDQIRPGDKTRSSSIPLRGRNGGGNDYDEGPPGDYMSDGPVNTQSQKPDSQPGPVGAGGPPAQPPSTKGHEVTDVPVRPRNCTPDGSGGNNARQGDHAAAEVPCSQSEDGPQRQPSIELSLHSQARDEGQDTDPPARGDSSAATVIMDSAEHQGNETLYSLGRHWGLLIDEEQVGLPLETMGLAASRSLQVEPQTAKSLILLPMNKVS